MANVWILYDQGQTQQMKSRTGLWYDTIDTIEDFKVDSKAEYSALSVAHVVRKKETKTNKRQWPFNSVQVKIDNSNSNN